MNLRPMAFATTASIILLLAVPGYGHRTPEALTSVEFKTESVEIVHKFHAHDVTRLLDNQYQISIPDFENPKHLAYLQWYVSERFSFQLEQSNATLTDVGAELLGNYIVVYQELESTDHQQAMVANIASSLLVDEFTGATSQVNITRQGKTRTLRFERVEQSFSVQLTEP